MDYISESCYFFECYEKVEPTNQGRNLLINTYCACASELLKSNDPSDDLRALALLEKGKACDGRMDPNYALHNRFAVGETLYDMLYKLYERLGKQQESYEALLRLVHYSRKRLMEKKDNLRVRRFADYCCKCVEHPFYDRAADPIGLDKAIALIDAYCTGIFTYGITKYLDTLKKYQG